MSNFIPMVSSSPPPLDDGGGFNDWGDEDDDFGNFTSAADGDFQSFNDNDNSDFKWGSFPDNNNENQNEIPKFADFGNFNANPGESCDTIKENILNDKMKETQETNVSMSNNIKNGELKGPGLELNLDKPLTAYDKENTQTDNVSPDEQNDVMGENKSFVKSHSENNFNSISSISPGDSGLCSIDISPVPQSDDNYDLCDKSQGSDVDDFGDFQSDSSVGKESSDVQGEVKGNDSTICDKANIPSVDGARQEETDNANISISESFTDSAETHQEVVLSHSDDVSSQMNNEAGEQTQLSDSSHSSVHSSVGKDCNSSSGNVNEIQRIEETESVTEKVDVPSVNSDVDRKQQSDVVCDNTVGESASSLCENAVAILESEDTNCSQVSKDIADDARDIEEQNRDDTSVDKFVENSECSTPECDVSGEEKDNNEAEFGASQECSAVESNSNTNSKEIAYGKDDEFETSDIKSSSNDAKTCDLDHTDQELSKSKEDDSSVKDLSKSELDESIGQNLSKSDSKDSDKLNDNVSEVASNIHITVSNEHGQSTDTFQNDGSEEMQDDDFADFNSADLDNDFDIKHDYSGSADLDLPSIKAYSITPTDSQAELSGESAKVGDGSQQEENDNKTEDDLDDFDDFDDFAEFQSESNGNFDADKTNVISSDGDFGDSKSENTSKSDFATFQSGDSDGGWAADFQSAGNDNKDDGWATFQSSEIEDKQIDNDDDMDDFGDFSTSAVCTTTLKQSEPHLDVVQKKVEPDSILSICFPDSEKLNDSQDVPCVLDVKTYKSSEDRKTSPFIWSNLKSSDVSTRLARLWSDSRGNKVLFQALRIDTRNILLGHRKPSVPVYASNLTLLEPTKGPVPSEVKPETKLVDTTKPEEKATRSQDLPPVQFDWTNSGLTNPLEANNKTLELDFLVVKETESASKNGVFDSELMHGRDPAKAGMQPLQNILANLKTNSTMKKVRQTENLTKEATKVLGQLPTLSFMQAKVLMFPFKEGNN